VLLDKDRKPLTPELINTSIADRDYQIRASLFYVIAEESAAP